MIMEIFQRIKNNILIRKRQLKQKHIQTALLRRKSINTFNNNSSNHRNIPKLVRINRIVGIIVLVRIIRIIDLMMITVAIAVLIEIIRK